MQCNLPFCGGISNCSPFYPWSPASALSYNAPFPTVVGEGDVSTLMMPDGTVQFYFLPVNKWSSPPNVCNPSLPNCNNPYCNSPGIWFIRSVSNPNPQPTFQQQTPMTCDVPYQRSFICVNSCPSQINSTGNNIAFSPKCYKFHIDGCTSTTDIDYFFPRPRASVVPKPCASAGVQVTAPVDASTGRCECEVVCRKPYNCDTKKEAGTFYCSEISERIKTYTPNYGSSCMSYEEEKPQRRSSKKKTQRQIKEKHKKRNNGIVICECYSSEPETTGSSKRSMSVDKIKSFTKSNTKKEKKADKKNPKKTTASSKIIEETKAVSKDSRKKDKKKERKKPENTTETQSNVSTAKTKTKVKSFKRQNVKKDHICECYSNSTSGTSQYSMSTDEMAPEERSCCRKEDNSQSSTSTSKKSTKSSKSYRIANNKAKSSSNKKKRNKYSSDSSTPGSDKTTESGQTRDTFAIESKIDGTRKNKLKKSTSNSEEALCCLGADIKEKQTGHHYECECGTCGVEYLNKLAAISTGQETDCIPQSGQQTQVSCSNVQLELWFPKAPIVEKAEFSGESMSVCVSESNSLCSC